MKRLLIAVIATLLTLCASALPADRVKWNNGWLFINGDSVIYSTPQYIDSTWRHVDLPHDFSREGHASPTLASCTGYFPGGIGWYRKHFNIDNIDNAQGTHILFDGIYNRSDIYLNGKRIGGRPNGYVSHYYDLTPYLKEGDNVLAVRVDHSRYADSRWYTGSGIYRNVWLYREPDSHIPLWGVSYDATIKSPQLATLTIKVETAGVTNKQRIDVTLLDRNGRKVAAKTAKATGDTTTVTLDVKTPHLWDLDDPYLYTLTTSLLDGRKVIDSDVTRVGLRSIAFHPDNGFSLNGREMKLKGVCLHHDNGALGAAVPREVLHRRILALKEMGANAIRCSHNPQAPEFYELCDSLGMLVMDEASDEWEFPKRKWIEGWNQGTPGFDGTYDFFEEWIDRDVADMVRRDRCHPSMILWSIGNEVDYPNDPYSHPVLDSLANSGFTQASHGGYNPEAPNAERIGHIAMRLAGVVRQHDRSRPVTGALAGVLMSNHTLYPQAVDVVGYNYTEGRYDSDHKAYPERIIYGSENRSDYKAWRDVITRPYIAGQFIWTGADYLGESGRWPSRGLGTGLLSFTSQLKPRGHFRQALWSDSAVAYIGTYPARWEQISIDAPAVWNYDQGDRVRVICYTNQPQARLLLNGTQVGVTKQYDDSTGVISWVIPYSPGTLTVEALDGDMQVAATHTIHTVTRPATMRAKVDHRSSSDSIKIVDIEILDDNGNLCVLADNDIMVHTVGCRLLALDSGSNSDMSDPRARHRRADRGRLTAYIKTEPGREARLILSSPLIPKISISLTDN